MPSMLLLVFEKLKDHPQIGIGGVVGFPSGGETTASKLFQAKELKEAGCNEIDMVLNIGKLKSGMLNDICFIAPSMMSSTSWRVESARTALISIRRAISREEMIGL